MEPQSKSQSRFSFGPFEVNAATGELLKTGSRVRLTGQPFQILLILLRRPGDLVTRTELSDALWGLDTVVDFDQSLNTAVNKLRRALGDSADKPRYIETVPARGYRFIAALQSSLPSTPARPPEYPTEDSTPARLARAGSGRLWRLVLPSAVAVFAVVAGLFYFRRAPTLTSRDTIVLAEFRNTTHDPVFDGTLRSALAAQLEQSPFLKITSENRIQKVLGMMGHPANAELTPEIAREVCERTGSAAVLSGSIASLGSKYTLGLIAQSCVTEDVLDRQQVQADRKEDVLNTLSQMAVRFRARAGESIALIQKHSIPLEDATTPSLDALKAFSMGWKAFVSQGHGAGVPFFRRATEMDPKFATAHAWLGRAYGGVGESVLALQSTTRAWELRERATDQERFYIDFSYYRMVTGELEKAAQTCELWARTYPRDVRPHGLLSGSTSASLAKYESGAEEARRAIDLDPDHSFAYTNLARYYITQDRLEEAEKTLQRAVDRNVALPDILAVRYDIAFLRGDSKQLEQLAAVGLEKSGLNDWLYEKQSGVLASSGHLRQARTMSRRAVDLCQAAGRGDSAAQHEAGIAVREALFGNKFEARQAATAARALSNGRDAEYGAAVALAVAGDSLAARRIADDLEARFPKDTSVKFSYVPVLRALIALQRRDHTGAIAHLQVAAPYEMAFQGNSSVGFSGTLYPIYVRGLAFLGARRGAEAAAEFDKILDNRGMMGTDAMAILARLQLARAFVLAGDPTRATAAYEDFLVRWKDADPTIPILNSAKSEYRVSIKVRATGTRLGSR